METRGRPRHKRAIEFECGEDVRRATDNLQAFYKLKTRSKLLEMMVLLCVGDVASLPEDKSWTEVQRVAFCYCHKAAEEFREAIGLIVAKDVLAEKEPNARMSVQELGRLTKAKLIALAHEAGIATTGLRKTGIIRKLKFKEATDDEKFERH